eukprot:2967275-Alexandrium_andersonii.AAC.1
MPGVLRIAVARSSLRFPFSCAGLVNLGQPLFGGGMEVQPCAYRCCCCLRCHSICVSASSASWTLVRHGTP